MLTPEQVANVRRWQDAEHVHPLTCGNCSCQSPMSVIDDGTGLRCVHCKHVQTWVPEVCLAGPPDLPAALSQHNRGGAAKAPDTGEGESER